MQRYARRCRNGCEPVQSDPKTWPALESEHRLVHGLESRVDALIELLDPMPASAAEVEFLVETCTAVT
jgi:hypothetical protein